MLRSLPLPALLAAPSDSSWWATDEAKARVFERLNDLFAFLPLLAVGLLIFFAALALSRWMNTWRRPYRRLSQNAFLRDVLRQSVAVGALLVGILIALDVMGATSVVAAVLGTAGVAGLAVGFAFKDIIENYIAGVLLSLRQPFAPDDFVDIDGESGQVVRLTMRATILMTADGNHLRLPNAKVFKATILNTTRNPLRRFDIGVGVGVDADLLEAQELGIGVLRGIDGVLEDPSPKALVEELGDSNVAVRFFGWVDQRSHGFLQVKSEAIRLVKTRLEDAGIDMPEPIYRVHLQGTGVTQIGGPTDVPQAASAQEKASEEPDPVQRRPQQPEPTRAVDTRRGENELASALEQERRDSAENLLNDQAARE